MKSLENFKGHFDKGLKVATILSFLLAADQNLAQAEERHNGSRARAAHFEKEQEEIISARKVIRRTMDYVKERGKIHIDANADTPANLLARVMISEEGGYEDKAHVAVLIAWTVLNRLENKEDFSNADLKKVITSGKGFGLQSGGRQFSSNQDPVRGDNKSGSIYRVIAQAILDGCFDDYNFGQKNFIHVATQNELAAAGKAKPASQVEAEWEAGGLEEISIPGVDPKYIKFFK
ncbi:MAG TPA: hypothetical protein PKZ16_01230 [bacterium]|nr:hypothetical protein [bacterium]HPL95505.1 hypothetical protein [bacterium]